MMLIMITMVYPMPKILMMTTMVSTTGNKNSFRAVSLAKNNRHSTTITTIYPTGQMMIGTETDLRTSQKLPYLG